MQELWSLDLDCANVGKHVGMSKCVCVCYATEGVAECIEGSFWPLLSFHRTNEATEEIEKLPWN